MNQIVSIGVSLEVSSMIVSASLCTMSSFSRFVCDIDVRVDPFSVTLSTIFHH